ncbi:MAG: hypothetical protein H9802_08095 [Candidatus Phocaeicola faecipullorum]|nr:hypothetical protein [Candidatus Phocaeicola faecipullorum]
MEKRQHVEDRSISTGLVNEPEVTYARQSKMSMIRKDVLQSGITDHTKEKAAAWRRQIDEFIAESNRIYETGDTAARKDLARRMEAFMREENTMEHRLERIDWSLEQIRRGEYMTAEEADEAVRRALPWLR